MPTQELNTHLSAGAATLASPGTVTNRSDLVTADAPPTPATFDFTVSALTVNNPRSLFNDSDFATLAVSVLAADNTVIKQYGQVVRSLGNLGKGAAIDPNLSVTSIPVPDGGSLAVSFVVVNKGGWSWDSAAIGALELAGSAVLGALVQGTIVAPTVTAAATATTAAVTTTTATVTLSWVIGIGAAIIGALEGINILFADCDGTVVPGVLSLGKTELLQFAATGQWNITYVYPGTDSPDGCGANSTYTVTYTVQATPPPVPLVAVPHVVGQSVVNGVRALNAAGLIGIERLLKTANATPNTILAQSPAAGTMVAAHSEVTYEVQAPHIIQA